MWRLIALALAPYAYGLLLMVPARPLPDIRIHRYEPRLGSCRGTDSRVEIERGLRPPGEVPVRDGPVAGWKLVELPGLRLDSNHPRSHVASLAWKIWLGLAEVRASLAVPESAGVSVRVFRTQEQLEEYARYLGIAGVRSFLDLDRREVVAGGMRHADVVANVLHQAVHLWASDAPEETAERFSKLRIGASLRPP